MTSSASSTSTCSRASSVRSSCSTTMSRPPSAASSSSAIRSWKFSRVKRSPELARHVLLRALVAGLGEDDVGRPVLDQLPVEHERSGVGHASGLLHVVRDDDDRVALLEVGDELLDLQRRDRIEGRARLLHEEDLGLDGDRAGDAQALLLAAGEPDAGLAEAVLDLLPQPRSAQRLLDALARVAPGAAEAQARGDVVVD